MPREQMEVVELFNWHYGKMLKEIIVGMITIQVLLNLF